MSGEAADHPSSNSSPSPSPSPSPGADLRSNSSLAHSDSRFVALFPGQNLGLVAAAVIAALTVLKYAVAAGVGFTEDEAYYRLWSLAPALSYFDHPPFIAWIIALGRGLGGDTALGARLLGPIFSIAGLAALFRIAYLYAGRDTALVAVLFCAAMPLLAVTGVIVTPDTPSVLFYSLTLWAAFELERSRDANWWLAIGVFAGCGLLSKYTNVFAGAGLLLWLVWVPQNRVWFKSKQLWAGGLIAVLLFAPVLIWNFENHGASFAKQFGRAAGGNGWTLKYLAEFIGAQLGIMSPVIAVLGVTGLAPIVRRAVRDRASSETLIVAFGVPMIAYFAFHALHDRVQANWLVPVFPLVALSAALALHAQQSAHRFRSLLWGAGLATAITLAIFLQAFVPFAPLAKEPTQQMRGWREFAARIEETRQKSGAEWLATASFATTAQLSFVFRNAVPVAQLDEQIRYQNLPVLPPSTLQSAALFVDLKRRTDATALQRCFRSTEPLGDVVRHDGSVAGEVYALYKLNGFNPECGDGPLALRAAPVAAPH